METNQTKKNELTREILYLYSHLSNGFSSHTQNLDINEEPGQNIDFQDTSKPVAQMKYLQKFQVPTNMVLISYHTCVIVTVYFQLALPAIQWARSTWYHGLNTCTCRWALFAYIWL